MNLTAEEQELAETTDDVCVFLYLCRVLAMGNGGKNPHCEGNSCDGMREEAAYWYSVHPKNEDS